MKVIYEKNDIFYIMRDCYYKMLDLILDKFDDNNTYQRNYLVFGHLGIGKSILACIIREHIHNIDKNIGIIHIYRQGNRSNTYSYNENSKKYIVISDEVVIGEDDFPDAKMIILIANSSNEKYKTFQSKRCCLVMYIPPFTKEEIKRVIMVNDSRNESMFKLLKQNNHFINVEENKMKMKEDRNECYNKQKYIDNCKYYGGIIGNFNVKIDSINEEVERTKTNMKVIIEDIVRGIKKSSNSKIY